MHLRECTSSHFIWTIQDGVIKRVHNTDSRGRPGLKFNKLEDIFKSADAERKPFPFAERNTRAISGIVEEDVPDCQFNETGLEEMTLSHLRKKCKRKKRKASESVLMSPKVEDDDPDLSEPLCKFRFKVSKRSPIMEYFECKDTTFMDDNSSKCNPSAESIFDVVTHEKESRERGLFTNDGEICVINEGPVYNSNSEEDLPNVILPMQEFGMDKEEYVCHPLSVVRPLEEDSSLEDLNTSMSDCFHSQQTSEQDGYMCGVQDLESTIDDDDCCEDIGQSTPMPDYLCLPWKSHSWVSSNEHDVDVDVDEHDDDGLSMEVKSPIHDSNFLISDNNSSDSEDVSRFPDRLPLTRKAISPKSKEKLCLAMKYAELSDDVDFYKCKEKLKFEEPNENEFSSTTSDIKDNESNLQPNQATLLSQNKTFISSKQLHKRSKICKKGYPPQSLPKGCLDGPRLCRSLPRLSTGCTSIQGCSESAIAFSERQMHDIESLASKLMSELNSMKAIVENKLLYEAYHARPLNNEIDEVKSAIKTATKTEETARKWLSMMARDCNRFCKIMKLNQDDNPSASADPTFLSTDHEKPVSPPLKKERKKISFADESGGTLCDIRVVSHMSITYRTIEGEPNKTLEPHENTRVEPVPKVNRSNDNPDPLKSQGNLSSPNTTIQETVTWNPRRDRSLVGWNDRCKEVSNDLRKCKGDDDEPGKIKREKMLRKEKKVQEHR
ncbi:uncharacterized protein [Rutidosis leptorrhynchoides]|uniref:uncharacterized protein n=1 Tax=Rutidosis leptorrhynchoides TaxID=125765 RepID=UPI003A9901DE